MGKKKGMAKKLQKESEVTLIIPGLVEMYWSALNY